jgi:heptosyltransferase-1/heptosyltransferase-2
MKMVIANDTGPMHLAFAQKTPTIGLFTPTDPALCGPYYVDAAVTIAKKPTCTPCLRKRCKEPFCLMQISVQEVYDTALDLYQRKCL